MKKLEGDLEQVERGTLNDMDRGVIGSEGKRKNSMATISTLFPLAMGLFMAGLEDFLLHMERLMTWTKDEFLKEVADQSWRLANRAVRG